MICGTVHLPGTWNPQPTCPVPFPTPRMQRVMPPIATRTRRFRSASPVCDSRFPRWRCRRRVDDLARRAATAARADLAAIRPVRRPGGLARARRCACGVVRCVAPRESSRDVAPRARLARAAGRGCARDCGPSRSSVHRQSRSLRPRLGLSVARASRNAARRTTLADWLLRPASRSEIVERQAATSVLAAEDDWRLRLEAHGVLAGGARQAEIDHFLMWAEGPDAFGRHAGLLRVVVFTLVAALWIPDRAACSHGPQSGGPRPIPLSCPGSSCRLRPRSAFRAHSIAPAGDRMRSHDMPRSSSMR